MLQALLAERFKLVIHREMKEMPVYALVVAKGGPKLQKADIEEKDCPDSSATPAPDPRPSVILWWRPGKRDLRAGCFNLRVGEWP